MKIEFGKESAICAKIDDQIVGILLFSRDNNILCFLAVDEDYRRRHIAEKMVAYMLELVKPEKDVVVTTYREGVPRGIAARVFYKRVGHLMSISRNFALPVLCPVDGQDILVT